MNLTWGWAVRSISAINWFLGFSSWEREEASGAEESEEGEQAASESSGILASHPKSYIYKLGILNDPDLPRLDNHCYEMNYKLFWVTSTSVAKRMNIG
jgi:hypothetical protein